MTSYIQLFPFKITFFEMKCCYKILIWFPDECLKPISVHLLISIVPLRQTSPPVLNKLTKHHCFQKINPACLLLKSLCCVCFFHFGVFAVPLRGGNRHVIPGSKVNVSFSCVVEFVVDRLY